MQRNLLNVLVSVLLVGIAAGVSANEAQSELQPQRIEFGSFKFPVGATSFISAAAQDEPVRSDYRFLTDYSPN